MDAANVEAGNGEYYPRPIRVLCFHFVSFNFPDAAGPVLVNLTRREPQRKRARLKAGQSFAGALQIS
jgi:hypothetical protein